MIRTLLKQVKEYKTASLLTPLFTGLEVLMEVLIPFVTASIIDKGIQAGDMGQVYFYGVVMLVLAFVSLAAGILAGRFGAKASSGFACNLRDAMYENIQTFAMLGVMVLASTKIGGRSARYFTQQQKDLGAVNGNLGKLCAVRHCGGAAGPLRLHRPDAGHPGGLSEPEQKRHPARQPDQPADQQRRHGHGGRPAGL